MQHSSEAIYRAQELREKAIVIDTETTGVAREDEVIELSVVRARDGAVLFNDRFRPSKRIERGAYAVHGIPDSALYGCKPFKAHYEAICAVLQGKTVAAWGASNDRRFLNQTFGKYDLLVPEINWVCAMRLHQQFRGQPKPSKLEDACREFRATPGDHSARADALAAARVIYGIALHGDKGEARPEHRDVPIDFELGGPVEPIAPQEFTEFEITPLGVKEGEFRRNVEFQKSLGRSVWPQLIEEESAQIEPLILRARDQIADLRFDQYGPRLSMAIQDQLYFEVMAFRKLRFARLNQIAKRRKALAEVEG